MIVAIYGLGYVGVTAAACIASDGHVVFGIDISEEKVRQVNQGRSPIKEPGVAERLQSATRAGLLRCLTDGADVLSDCEAALVCVGTPSLPDGSHDMTYVLDVSRQIAKAIHRHRPRRMSVVYRSTMRPGSMERLIWPLFDTILGGQTKGVELVYNPEFLREGTAVEDYLDPPKIVIGTHDGRPNAVLEELNKKISSRTFYTSYGEAELTKLVDNSFHAAKVVYANEIGRICWKLGISAHTIYDIFVADTKLNISPCYLRPGGPFGGSCLPKDVRALQYLSADVGGQTALVDALLRSNDAHKHFLFDLVTKELGPGAKVLMLGLAFKTHSDDLRESPKVDMARKLLDAGFRLSVYDPWLEEEQLVGQNLGYAFMHLPTLPQLLISEQGVQDEEFDLVVDTTGLGARMKLNCKKYINLHRLG